METWVLLAGLNLGSLHPLLETQSYEDCKAAGEKIVEAIYPDARAMGARNGILVCVQGRALVTQPLSKN